MRGGCLLVAPVGRSLRWASEHGSTCRIGGTLRCGATERRAFGRGSYTAGGAPVAQPLLMSPHFHAAWELVAGEEPYPGMLAVQIILQVLQPAFRYCSHCLWLLACSQPLCSVRTRLHALPLARLL